METWAALWKWFLILGAGAFGAVSIWVTIAGWSDIRRMFAALRDGDADDAADPGP